jgi:hypothetical protein
LGWGHTQMMPHELAYGYCQANHGGLQWWRNRIADQEVLMGDTTAPTHGRADRWPKGP